MAQAAMVQEPAQVTGLGTVAELVMAQGVDGGDYLHSKTSGDK